MTYVRLPLADDPSFERGSKRGRRIRLLGLGQVPASSHRLLNLSDDVVRVLKRAGWDEHGVSEPKVRGWVTRLEKEGNVVGPVARDALQTYGGLRVEGGGFGVDTYREAIGFRPELAALEFDRFSDFAQELGVGLVPLGELEHGNGFAGITDEGRVFGVSTEIWLYGYNIDKAVSNLVIGRKVAGPLVRPAEFIGRVSERRARR